MKNKIKKFLGKEYEVDNKIFLKALSLYSYVNADNPNSIIGNSYLRTITKVWATKKGRGNKVTVHIRSHAPGVLIGWHGVQIKGIKYYMEELCHERVEIDIQEEKMFSSSYWGI